MSVSVGVSASVSVSVRSVSVEAARDHVATMARMKQAASNHVGEREARWTRTGVGLRMMSTGGEQPPDPGQKRAPPDAYVYRRRTLAGRRKGWNSADREEGKVPLALMSAGGEQPVWQGKVLAGRGAGWVSADRKKGEPPGA